MSTWRIELLHKSHQRDAFDCGEESLNTFLRAYAGQHARRDISRTYVALPAGSDVVFGYYTLSSGRVGFENLPDEAAKHVPKYPVPTAHLKGAEILALDFMGESADNEGGGGLRDRDSSPRRSFPCSATFFARR